MKSNFSDTIPKPMRKNKLFSILILILTFISVNQWSSIPLGGTAFYWIISSLTIIYILIYKKKYFNPVNKKDYRFAKVYFLWMIVGVIRGCFVAENYWEWKQLVDGTFALSLPLFIYIFLDPHILQITLRIWFKYAIALFFMVFLWILSPGSYHFYLAPLLLIACFLPILTKKWRYITFALLILMIFADFGARSQMIKATIAILMSVAYVFSKYVTPKIIKIGLWLCYILPIIVLYLGISGQFNIFEDLSKNQGKYVKTKIVNGERIEEDLSADTRTFIYEEVILSALRHNYVLWGRTPARGNDSIAFGAYSAEDLGTGKYERFANEVCHPNVFTWLGLIGMILYSLLYFKSSYLAVYHSNNLFMKLLGVFIAFRWAYGWIEDFNRFDIMNISIWMMIAMGFSASFRKMDNSEFKYWIKGIFK